MRVRMSVSVVLALLVMAVTTGEGSAHGQRPPGPACGGPWGSLPKSVRATSAVPLLGARMGRHHCFDRVVFDVSGDAAGYDVRYADEFSTIGSGTPIPVVGGAVLVIDVSASGHDSRFNPTVPWRAGHHIVASDKLVRDGFQTFQSLVYGGSFEGRSLAALGVRARLPFRVFRLAGPGRNHRVVVDVAHRW